MKFKKILAITLVSVLCVTSTHQTRTGWFDWVAPMRESLLRSAQSFITSLRISKSTAAVAVVSGVVLTVFLKKAFALTSPTPTSLAPQTSSRIEAIEQDSHSIVKDLEVLKSNDTIKYGLESRCYGSADYRIYWIDILDNQDKKEIPTTNGLSGTLSDLLRDYGDPGRHNYNLLVKRFRNGETIYLEEPQRLHSTSVPDVYAYDPKQAVPSNEIDNRVKFYDKLVKEITSLYHIYITPNPEDNALVTSMLFNALRNHYANTQKPFYYNINVRNEGLQQEASQRTITITVASQKDANEVLKLVYDTLKDYKGRLDKEQCTQKYRKFVMSLISWEQGNSYDKSIGIYSHLFDESGICYNPDELGFSGESFYLDNPTVQEQK